MNLPKHFLSDSDCYPWQKGSGKSNLFIADFLLRKNWKNQGEDSVYSVFFLEAPPVKIHADNLINMLLKCLKQPCRQMLRLLMREPKEIRYVKAF